jgi:hypothetical protein
MSYRTSSLLLMLFFSAILPRRAAAQVVTATKQVFPLLAHFMGLTLM